MIKLLKISVISGLLLFVLIQLIPFGKDYSNPPVVKEPLWDSSETKALLKRACFNCHSNETIWPWYSKIAPASWLVAIDVAEAREKLNFSDWQDGIMPGENAKAVEKEVRKGEMPPFQYLLAHPEAKLNDAEKEKIIKGFTATTLRNR